MRKFGILLAIFLFFLFVFPAFAAKIGVGVGTGKIVVNEKLKPGVAYNLPSMTVFNTGSASATYKVRPAFNETQPEKKPEASWFNFSPKSFELKPKQAQTVVPNISLPLKADAGDYFVYLEAVPDETVQQGSTSIGVAAATKLYFTVEEASFWTALLNRISSLYKQFAPVSYWLTLIIFGLILLLVLRKFFKFSFRVQKRGNDTG